ncbi:hypothetical protein [Kineosporia succinea]|uniref:Integral membrane protein n=1 Tax=Kineosporia succinea TaxID=84632 RepID=A0ABT9NY37_9ACTN|nr:hypothetical protein [Kineosporia succinea]MDP9825341.1 hypothetical protein [Kineosporia succinea]
MVFAPEAHRPRDLRLLVDASGLTVEFGLGLRQNYAWADCAAVMVWPDRAELVLRGEGGEGAASLVVRAADWHHGDQAMRAISQRLPTDVLVTMLADDEPQPETYRLPGLAAGSGALLAVMALSAAVVGLLGLVIGAMDRSLSATAVGTVFLAGAVPPAHALFVRMRVPRRWREQAAVRGQAGVRITSVLARSGPATLGAALTAFAVLVVLNLLVALTVSTAALVPALLCGFATAGCARELLRRRRRQS